MFVPDWQLPPNVRCLVSTREGGVSDGRYGSMNLSDRVGDDEGAVWENRMRFTQAMEGEPQCAWLDQQHSAGIAPAHHIVAGNFPNTVDASWTDQSNIACVVLTADCVPILLAADDGSKVAAVHAGWRGLAKGVVASAIEEFSPSSFSAYIGPAISKDNYEVGADVRDALNDLQVDGGLVTSKGDGKFLADLPGVVAALLQKAGARQVVIDGRCTYAEQRMLFSARRGGQESGRMAAAVWKVVIG